MDPVSDLPRCAWCGSDPLYVTYHDTEWGVPERDARTLWEMLVLEGFQSGLSWITILRKRENFRAAFAGFDPVAVARFDDADVERLMGDAGIVRHRGKITGAITSARAFLALEESHGFADFIWRFVDGAPLQPGVTGSGPVVAQIPASVAMSKALKKAGFAFCGPTTCYAFMQAAGLVNDHAVTCHRHAALAGAIARP